MSFLEKKYKLNELFIACIGIKKSETKADEFIICKRRKNTYNSYYTYIDILTGNKYSEYSDYHTDNGQTVAFNPISYLSVFKSSELKDNLIKKGYTTKSEIIKTYNTLNEDNGHIITVEKKQTSIPDDCIILNDKDFKMEPALFREKELEQLMISIALNQKIIILTGDNGVGKTTLVDQLAYLIKNKQAPRFLKNTTIIEINIASLIAGENKTKNIENKIKEITEYAKENEAIIFFDDAEDIFTPTEKNDNYMNIASMLKFATEREDIKIITTISTTKLNEYKKHEDFKNKFDIIEIKQPNEDTLHLIGNLYLKSKTVAEKFSINNIEENIENIIKIIVNCTKSTNINTITNLQNPGLMISIIDDAFAITKVEDSKTLTIEHIISAIERNHNLENRKKEIAVTELKELKITKKEKILKKTLGF